MIEVDLTNKQWESWDIVIYNECNLHNQHYPIDQ